jgi:serine/threonine protein kinase
MPPQDRYQIIDTIAKGDFATVFRARDLELGREVAVKQIHQQYLDDPTQLEQYWAEAQLLASLNHPFIMTIYDVVRERGWLILELMHGNIRDRLAGQACDLEYLRLTITYVLHALRFLEENGIVHGDVKPTNLLLDHNNRVKLGDFGIARRLSGDEGSVVKGTTKYMAPEVVSDQFGEVGPHSDLYSLGFTAYELMCGTHFETLFPGLNMFGRDEQMAWMMWHTAADRRLPEIHRVLQGVPEDLAYVIEKLVEKNPAKRYRHAQEAIVDLKEKMTPEAKAAEAEALQAEQSAKQSKRKRIFAIGAVALSLILSLGVAFLPSGPEEDPPPVVEVDKPEAGIVRKINTKLDGFTLKPEGDGDLAPIPFNEELDRISINGEPAGIGDLRPGDRVDIEWMTKSDGSEFIEVKVTRGAKNEVQGVIAELNVPDQIITLSVTEGDDARDVSVYVPSDLAISLNGSTEISGRPYRLASLKAGDRLTIQYVPKGDDLRATAVAALRHVPASGKLVRYDATNRKLTWRTDAGDEVTMPVAADCSIILNGRRELDGRIVALSDLKAEDRVRMQRDVEIAEIDAMRAFAIVGNVLSSGPAGLQVEIPGRADPVRFELADDCPITLAARGKAMSADFLRPGDRLTLEHDSPDLVDPTAQYITIDAIKADPRAWALVIGQQEYDNVALPVLPHPENDAKLVYETLVDDYRVAPQQIELLQDVSRDVMEERISQFLGRTARGGQLIVYYVGHAFLDDADNAYLAGTDFDPALPRQTGMPLKFLVTELEACPAAEKILMLDTAHFGERGREIPMQPSAADLARSLKEEPISPVSTSVEVIASSLGDERGLTLLNADTEQVFGLFAQSIASAFSGAADVDGDGRVNTAELFTQLKAEMAEFEPQNRYHAGKTQTPVRFIPNPNPDRMSEEGREAVREVLHYLRGGQLDAETRKALDEALAGAMAAAPKQPDGGVAYGLVLLKHGLTSDSLKAFELTLAQHPTAVVAHQALAWQHFNRRDYEQGMKHLAQLIENLPPPKPGETYDAHAKAILRWAGRMREFAATAAESPLPANNTQLQRFTNAFRDRDRESLSYCKHGVDDVRAQMNTLKQQLALATDDAQRASITRKSQRLSTYVDFDYDAVADYVRSRLDE